MEAEGGDGPAGPAADAAFPFRRPVTFSVASVGSPEGRARPSEAVAGLEQPGGPPLGEPLVEHMCSTALDVRRGLLRVCDGARRIGLAEEDCATLEIVLAEALNNVVEHAYEDEPTGWILLEVDCLPDWIVCRVTDGGRPMPEERLPSPQGRDLEMPLANLPEGGFGWMMILDLACHLHYDREGRTNCLSFALPVAAAGPAGVP